MIITDFSHALTLHRPWPKAMLLGPKEIENRDWPPPPELFGRRFWLHSGKKFDEEAEVYIAKHWPEFHDTRWHGGSETPGTIVGHARLIGVLRGNAKRFEILQPTGADEELGPLKLDREYDDRMRAVVARQRPWFFGEYGWVLDERTPIAKPVVCRGLQKLWRVPADVRAALKDAA